MRSSGFLSSRDVAQPGRALAWGARGRQFKSARPDQFVLRSSLANYARDFASGLSSSQSLRVTPAKRLNLGCEGSAVQICPSRPYILRSLANCARDFASGLSPSQSLRVTPAKRLNLGCEGSAVQICPSRPFVLRSLANCARDFASGLPLRSRPQPGSTSAG